MSSFQSSICGNVTRRSGRCPLLLYCPLSVSLSPDTSSKREIRVISLRAGQSRTARRIVFCILYQLPKQTLVFSWPMTTVHRGKFASGGAGPGHRKGQGSQPGHSLVTLSPRWLNSSTIQKLLILAQTESWLSPLYHNCYNNQTRPGLRHCYVCE